MKKENQNKFSLIKYICITAIVILSVINMVYWASKKEGYYGDELYSYEFVCQTEYPSINENRGDNIYINHWHDSSYFQDYFIVSEGEQFDFTGVYNSIKTDVHPPVYYWLLHLACSFCMNSFSKWSGIILNIVFFVISLIVLFLLVREISESAIAQLATCLLYGISVGAVSNGVFIRMYMVLTCATLMFTLFHAKLWNLKENTLFKTRIKIYIGIFLTTIFGILTQYYFIIFAFFMCIVWWGYLLIRRNFRLMIEYTSVMIGGLISSYLLWPRMYFQIFKGYRGEEAFNNFRTNDNFFVDFIRIINNNLFSGKIILLCIILFVILLAGICYKAIRIMLIKKQGKHIDSNYINKIRPTIKEMILVNIFVAVLGDLLIVGRISPYKTDRYLFNIMPFIILLSVLLTLYIAKYVYSIKIINIILVSVIAVFVVGSYSTTGVNYLYTGNDQKFEIINEKVADPIVLITDNNRRYISNCASIYFQNGQKVYSTDQLGIELILEALTLVEHNNEFLIFIDPKLSEDEILGRIVEMTQAVNTELLFRCEGGNVYCVKI